MADPSNSPTTTSTLSEAASKDLVERYGVPLASEYVVSDVESAVSAAAAIGGAVAVKLNGETIAHKTERGLVRLSLADESAVRSAAEELLAAARPEDGDVSLLVAPMVSGAREFIVVMIRDPQFGPMVMLGVGGVLAEAIADVAFRPAPVDEVTAQEQIDSLKMSDLLGEFRGEAAVDQKLILDILVGLGTLAEEHPEVMSVDINPLIIDRSGRPVAVDALVEVAETLNRDTSITSRPKPTDDHFRALFEPSGVVVTGASSHPGKFGFVALHNLLAAGYSGNVFATNRSGEEVLGIQTISDVAELPDGAADLMFVCTPASANLQLLEDAAQRGVKAAFLTSAGYGEAGEEGRMAEAELVATADRLGILLAGPNGQGVVSTPASLCAQIVAPYPPTGGIGVASQSGNFVSSFLNLSRSTGVGVSRAVSAGNAAAVSVADYLDFYSRDDKTAVSLAYIEGITDGRGLMERLAGAARHKPLVVLKGGATAGGARAAASHTGALAADDRIFDGACQAAGLTRVHSVEEAFDAAATFATQPLPKGPNVVILTTAGGWGVVTSDAVTRDNDLTLMQLPEELLAQIDEHLPPRWSRNNPVDCAGGETRDTIPTVMSLIAHHSDVHSVIYLGVGIQSNQAREMQTGQFYPDHGLERIVEYHERQDRRFAEAAAQLSAETGKPILVATELAVADANNAGPAAVRESGRLCYSTGDRAVVALGHMWRYAQFQDRRRS